MTKQINVLNVVSDERISGPVRRVLEVAKHLKNMGVETIVAMPTGEDDFRHALEEYNIRYYANPVLRRLRKSFNPLHNIKWLVSFLPAISYLHRIIKSENIHIVHCNGLIQVMSGLAGRKAGIKILWHLNDVAVPKYFLRIFKPFILSCADLTVFASKAVQDQFGDLDGRVDSAIFYAPVDCSSFSPDKAAVAEHKVRTAYGIDERETVVGMVANVNKLKGVLDFVAAAAIIRKRRPDIKFLHVGAKLSTKEDLYHEVEAGIERANLSKHFIMAGKQMNIRDFLAVMDVYVIPSISEACPISLLEAMAMERPIVATDVGGIPELVRDGEEGFLVPVHSPEKIAEKVLAYLDQPELAKINSRKARIRAELLFDITQCVENHVKYYRQLLA